MTIVDSRGQRLLEVPEWRQIVNGATDTAIISTDHDGLITSWNTGAHRILGWSEDEALGQTLERIFTEEDRSRGQLAREIADAERLGRGGGEEGWRVRKNGSRFWAAGELTPIRDENHRTIGFIKILRDRTAQRQAEEEIREERQALEIQNRAASSLPLESDRQRIIQIVTDASVELSGAEFGAFFCNEMSGTGESYELYAFSGSRLEALGGSERARFTQLFKFTYQHEGIVRSEDLARDSQFAAPLEAAPPEHAPVRSYLAIPVSSRAGTVIGVLLLAHSKIGIFSARTQTRLVGLAAEAAVAVANADLTQELRHLNATLEQQVAERTEQLKKNEEALRQSQKIEAIGQLTGGVAHDFNNLLQVIIGNLETLRRCVPADAPRAARAVESAMGGAKRAASLTQRLLAFSRRQPLNPKPIDVNVLVSGMSDLLHRTLGETTEVDTVRRAGLWRVEVDPTELEAAILNLALNARDAMPEGGRMTIETANVDIHPDHPSTQADLVPGQYVSLSVSDTGIGMDDHTASRVFEPFFTTKPVGRGTGLGLSQVYGFVTQSGGQVRISSTVGRGTAVSIYLPRLLRDYEPIAVVENTDVPAGTPRETILVTEDDDDVREYSVETLRELGYRVIEAHDGPSALRLLERQPKVDLLFTDVVLPGGMTGAQLAAQARGSRPELKVLFTTGYARNAIVHHGRLDRGVQLITKPFAVAELGARVRDVLDRASDQDR